MKKLLVASAVAALFLSACGGGGSSSSAAAPAPVLKLSYSGSPLQATAPAVAHAAVIHAASDTPASDPNATATVTDLTAALAATGVTANVTVQTMDGTALHALIMATDNGASPPQSAYGTVDPTNWNIVNFTFPDMVTTMDVLSQQEESVQFVQDLTVFTQRGYVAGMETFVVMPIPTCNASSTMTAAGGLALAIGGSRSLNFPVGNITPAEAAGHMGTDCLTPDTYITNLRTQRVASDITTLWNLRINPTPPTSTPMCSATVTTNCQIQQ
ncbi:hypothetical protein [Burkholderia sp. S171]|uniref:hypothetical protein n=1 Tax=Burkholderia sp. S171 TaxID=1641860 RepID=UPI00131BC879|nr:hypothetical protein [Burkholderia sp. S171]